MKQDWTPDSWRKKKALHQPIYTDKKKLDKAVKKNEKTSPVGFRWGSKKFKK